MWTTFSRVRLHVGIVLPLVIVLGPCLAYLHAYRVSSGGVSEAPTMCMGPISEIAVLGKVMLSFPRDADSERLKPWL